MLLPQPGRGDRAAAATASAWLATQQLLLLPQPGRGDQLLLLLLPLLAGVTCCYGIAVSNVVRKAAAE